MHPALLTSIVVAFFGALITGTLGLAAFFVVRWIKGLDLSADKLSSAIERLTDSVVQLDKKMDLMDRDMRAHDEAILALQTRACALPDCPWHTPGERTQRTRMEDAHG